MAEEQEYYTPGDWGTFSLGTAETHTQNISFNQPINDNPKIVALFHGQVIKEYTEGNGITVGAGRTSLDWVIDGADFEPAINAVVELHFSMYIEGRTEYKMKFRVFKSNV